MTGLFEMMVNKITIGDGNFTHYHMTGLFEMMVNKITITISGLNHPETETSGTETSRD